MEDIKIIELFFNRDETAIQELSNKYSGYCYKIVWNLLNNHEDVEECLNDTWLAAWEYIPPRRPSVLSAYVGKIARGFAIDCFRKKQAAKRMDGHVAENVCVQNVLKIWEDGKDQKLTQLLFCDLSTPENDGNFNVYDDIRKKLVAAGVPENEIEFSTMRMRRLNSLTR